VLMLAESPLRVPADSGDGDCLPPGLTNSDEKSPDQLRLLLVK
jgi:hypothetical protein